MAKKRAASTPPDRESPTCEKQKPGNEIEEIFASKKKKKKGSDPELNNPSVEGTNAVQKKKVKKMQTTTKMKEKSKSKANSSKADGFSDPPSRPRRRTQDGLAVYSAEELGLGKADAGGVIKWLEKIQRDFLWNKLSESYKYHLVGWNVVRNPLQEGDIDYLSLRTVNATFLSKWF